MFFTSPYFLVTAPILSCTVMPFVTILTVLIVSNLKVSLTENEVYLNSSDSYKNIYKENYQKTAKMNRFKYSLWGGILVQLLIVILASLSIGFLFLGGYLS
jgi:uncharacterized membrane protein SpoIIM required for sporulation